MNGSERVFAALAAAQAMKAGEDPDMAADIAEGEAAIRSLLRAVRCPHRPCNAAPGKDCRNHRGQRLPNNIVHPSRRDAAEGSSYEGAA